MRLATCRIEHVSVELTLHPHIVSAQFSASLQFSTVPVLSLRETIISYCVLIVCCVVELPDAVEFDDTGHSGFMHVSLRSATL